MERQDFTHAKIRNILSPISDKKDEGHPSVSLHLLIIHIFDSFGTMATTVHGSYTGSPQVLSFDGLLFDFDGTIIDSTAGM